MDEKCNLPYFMGHSVTFRNLMGERVIYSYTKIVSIKLHYKSFIVSENVNLELRFIFLTENIFFKIKKKFPALGGLR